MSLTCRDFEFLLLIVTAPSYDADFIFYHSLLGAKEVEIVYPLL